jgi:sulfur carrier protein
MPNRRVSYNEYPRRGPEPAPAWLREVCLITIQLNGEPREVPDGLTLAALVEWLKLPADRVAVEHNLEIVPRKQWPRTPIRAGDRLEVVHFVGGGTERPRGRDAHEPEPR